MSAAKRKVVVYGNCQGGAIAHLLTHMPSVTERWDVVTHDIWARGDALARQCADIDEADWLLAQDIHNWNADPRRERVTPATRVLRFPFCYVAPLWPFDSVVQGQDVAMVLAMNAHNAANTGTPFPFGFQDGLLGRMRAEFPDPAERLARYRAWDFPEMPDIERYAAFEEARLLKMDRDLGWTVGRFMAEHYRTTRLFHAIVHPAAPLIDRLMAEIADAMDLDPTEAPAFDDYMRHYQVPVHPHVIATLGLTWVAPDSTYAQPSGEHLTFDAYYERYVTLV